MHVCPDRTSQRPQRHVRVRVEDVARIRIPVVDERAAHASDVYQFSDDAIAVSVGVGVARAVVERVADGDAADAYLPDLPHLIAKCRPVIAVADADTDTEADADDDSPRIYDSFHYIYSSLSESLLFSQRLGKFYKYHIMLHIFYISQSQIWFNKFWSGHIM